LNIVKPSAEIISIHGYARYAPGFDMAGIATLRFIEWAGRISHRSEDAATADSYDRFLRAVVIGHGDWSIVEHASASVDMTVDRGITHELVRHRLFSFTQESTRFVNYEKKMPASFIAPIPLSDPDAWKNGQLIDNGFSPAVAQVWSDAIETAETSYKAMLKLGCSPQIARSVFPNALASRIIVTGNLRNWRHFLLMRTTKESHPQMREVTIPLLAQFKEKIPILFEDIEPMSKQSDAIAKGR
jgi:thymidylate synthase (FAD)